MRHPRLLVCRDEVGIGERLRDLARQRKWFFRSRRRPAACLRLLRRGCPTVLVLGVGGRLIGRALEDEFRLLERVAWLFPDTMMIVVLGREDPALAALAWDLGARYVLTTAQARDWLPDIVVGLMKAAMSCSMSGD
jgi:hypothetical protein